MPDLEVSEVQNSKTPEPINIKFGVVITLGISPCILKFKIIAPAVVFQHIMKYQSCVVCIFFPFLLASQA